MRAESAGCSEESFFSSVPRGSGAAALLAAAEPASEAATDSDPFAVPAFCAAASGAAATKASASMMRPMSFVFGITASLRRTARV